MKDNEDLKEKIGIEKINAVTINTKKKKKKKKKRKNGAKGKKKMSNEKNRIHLNCNI